MAAESTEPIERWTAKLRQAAGPRTTHREGVLEPVGEFPAAGGP